VRETTDNWLRVRVEDGGAGARPSYLGPAPTPGRDISLPYGLKVSLNETTGRRDVIEILEGVNIGVRASVGHDPRGQSYLTTKISHRPAGHAIFKRDAQQLYFGGTGPYNAFTGGDFRIGGQHFTPVPLGMYKLAIPAFPSKQTRNEYAQWATYHKSWFRLGLDISADRFLHTGMISEGCVTVRPFIYDPQAGRQPPRGFQDLPRLPPQAIGLPLPRVRAPLISWDDIYSYFILARTGDNQSVGTLVVM